MTSEAQIVVRGPTAGDAEAIREVNSLAVAALRKIYKPTEAAIKRKAARAPSRQRLVAESDGRVVATVECERRGDRLHLLGPMVHPDHQRRGIARALVDHIAGIAQSMGLAGLSLSTCRQTGNVPIFARLGFRVVRESVDESGLVENLTDEPLVDVYMERDV